MTLLPNGDKYVGEYKAGFWQGYGIYEYENGDRYEGQFSNGMKNGKGVFIYSDTEERLEGIWSNDEYLESSPMNCKPTTAHT